MNYYKLTFSTNRKETGVMPQSEEGYMGDIQQDFIPYQGIIDVDFKLPEPKLQKKAKHISYIDVVMIPKWFLVIDDELLVFFKRFSIGNYQDWKIKVWENKSLINKYNLFILNDTKQAKYINFANSEFYIGTYTDFTYKGEKVPIENYDHYLRERERLAKEKLWLRENKVVFDLRQVSEDMFRIINAPSGGYYVSEKLKNAIEKNGYTGMEFKDISELDKRIEVIY